MERWKNLQIFISGLETCSLSSSHVSQHAEGCGVRVEMARSDEKYASHCISVKNHLQECGGGRNGPPDLTSKDSHE